VKNVLAKIHGLCMESVLVIHGLCCTWCIKFKTLFIYMLRRFSFLYRCRTSFLVEILCICCMRNIPDEKSCCCTQYTSHLVQHMIWNMFHISLQNITRNIVGHSCFPRVDESIYLITVPCIGSKQNTQDDRGCPQMLLLK